MSSQSSAPAPVLVHATAVARHGAAVLLMGPSGSGKSDLALRLLAQPASPSLPTGHFELISDDQVWLQRDSAGLIATAPATIAGKLEVRGVGIVEVAAAASARVALVIELVEMRSIPRLPDPDTIELGGVVLPSLKLCGFDTSATIKVALALVAANAGKSDDGVGLIARL